MSLDDIKKLSDEDLTAKVANICGWKWYVFAENSACWIRSDGAQMWSEGCPDYTGDLNAMHEAEKMLTEDKELEYTDILSCLGDYKDGYNNIWRATARQRAEAFVLTMGSKI